MTIRLKQINKNKRKIAVVFLVTAIILIGIFKNHITIFYSLVIYEIGFFLSVPINEIEHSLLIFTYDLKIDRGLGILFYYPTYLFLHLFLIHTLFFDEKRVQNFLKMALLLIVFGLAFLSLIFKWLNFEEVGRIFYNLFYEFVGRPLILFLIEGGGLIFKGLNKWDTDS